MCNHWKMVVSLITRSLPSKKPRSQGSWLWTPGRAGLGAEGSTQARLGREPPARGSPVRQAPLPTVAWAGVAGLCLRVFRLLGKTESCGEQSRHVLEVQGLSCMKKATVEEEKLLGYSELMTNQFFFFFFFNKSRFYSPLCFAINCSFS